MAKTRREAEGGLEIPQPHIALARRDRCSGAALTSALQPDTYFTQPDPSGFPFGQISLLDVVSPCAVLTHVVDLWAALLRGVVCHLDLLSALDVGVCFPFPLSLAYPLD